LGRRWWILAVKVRLVTACLEVVWPVAAVLLSVVVQNLVSEQSGEQHTLCRPAAYVSLAAALVIRGRAGSRWPYRAESPAKDSL
jgi:hypothetical protein